MAKRVTHRFTSTSTTTLALNVSSLHGTLGPLTGSFVHSTYTAGNQFVVSNQNGNYVLNRHEMVTDTVNNRSYQVGTGSIGRRFEATLDNMTIASASYDSATKISTVTLPYTYDGSTDMVAVFLSGTDAGVVRVPKR